MTLLPVTFYCLHIPLATCWLLQPLGFILFMSVLLACDEYFSPHSLAFWWSVQKITSALNHSPLVCWGRVGEQHLHLNLNFEAMILYSERPATATNQTHFPTRLALKNTPPIPAAESCSLARPVKQFQKREKTLAR